MSDQPTPPEGSSGVPEGEKIVSVSRVIPVDAQVIFDILADPAMHAVIDGSSSVRKPLAGAPDRLALGAKFGMDMKIGLPYRITNEVVEFEEGRRIAWRHFGGHVWRYVLEPVEGGTRVTEQFDWRTNKAPLMLKVMRAVDRNRDSMVTTLEQLERVAGERSAGG